METGHRDKCSSEGTCSTPFNHSVLSPTVSSLLGISRDAAILFHPKKSSTGFEISRTFFSREREETESDTWEGISWSAIRGKGEDHIY